MENDPKDLTKPQLLSSGVRFSAVVEDMIRTANKWTGTVKEDWLFSAEVLRRATTQEKSPFPPEGEKLKEGVMLSELKVAYSEMIFLKRTVENETADNRLHGILSSASETLYYDRYKDRCRQFYALCDRYLGPTLP